MPAFGVGDLGRQLAAVAGDEALEVEAAPGTRLEDLPPACLTEILTACVEADASSAGASLAALGATCRACRAAERAAPWLYERLLRARFGAAAWRAGEGAAGGEASPKHEFERRVLQGRRAVALALNLERGPRHEELSYAELAFVGAEAHAALLREREAIAAPDLLQLRDSTQRHGGAGLTRALAHVGAVVAAQGVEAALAEEGGEEGPTASGSCLLECAISFSQYIMCTGGSDEGPTLPLAEVEEALRASVREAGAVARQRIEQARREAEDAGRRLEARALADAVLSTLFAGSPAGEPVVGPLRGNVTEYYRLENSCLFSLFRDRTGIPITLATAFCCVGEAAGLRGAQAAEMVPMPAHFLVRVTAAGCPRSSQALAEGDIDSLADECFIDLFGQPSGDAADQSELRPRFLSRRDCMMLMRRLVGRYVPQYLEPSPVWLVCVRIVNNILNALVSFGGSRPAGLQGVQASMTLKFRFKLLEALPPSVRVELIAQSLLLKRSILLKRDEQTGVGDELLLCKAFAQNHQWAAALDMFGAMGGALVPESGLGHAITEQGLMQHVLDTFNRYVSLMHSIDPMSVEPGSDEARSELANRVVVHLALSRLAHLRQPQRGSRKLPPFGTLMTERRLQRLMRAEGSQPFLVSALHGGVCAWMDGYGPPVDKNAVELRSQ